MSRKEIYVYLFSTIFILPKMTAFVHNMALLSHELRVCQNSVLMFFTRNDRATDDLVAVIRGEIHLRAAH